MLHPEVLALARAVADRYAGTLGDVLRLAIPPRHARAEATRATPAEGALPVGSAAGWQTYAHGLGFVAALRAGERPRAWWSAVPGQDPAQLVAEAVLATLGSGRGSVVCVPDIRDVARWDAVFTEVLGEGRHVALTAADEPADRYQAFLAASRGDVQVVLGTRAAAFAPVKDLGLVAMWDDGDDLFAEPRSPYPHAREVLLLRAATQETALLIGGHARTAEGQSLIDSGWCVELAADQRERRRAWPRLTVTDGSTAGSAPVRLPQEAFRAIRGGQGRRCWSRSRGAAIASRCRARRAASRPAARSVRARWASRPPRRRSRAAGAGVAPLRGPARTARAPSCVRRSSARCARLRSSPGRSPTWRS